MAEEPTWTADTTLGDWLHPRLSAWGGGAGTPVTSLVPGGYEAYARVFHPVEEGDDGDAGERTTWAQVCAAVGTTPHPAMQWEAISRTCHARRSSTSAWDGAVPETGTLPPSALAAVVDVLARWTAVDDCVMAVWDGFGWVSGQGTVLFGPAGTVHPGPAYPPHVLDGPRLQHPGRDYLLFTGPLASAQHLGQRTPDALRDAWPGEWLWRQSPSLLWPRDRSWCLATEVDLDSTVVGGAWGLVDALCTDPRLEAHPVDAATDLSSAGDRVNASA